MQIPGHHFPPLIIGSLALYLTCVYAYWDHIASQQAPLTPLGIAVDDATSTPEEVVLDEDEEDVSLIGQSDKPRATLEDREGNAALKVMFTGIPHPTLKEWSYATIGLNILLALFTLDMVFRGHLLHPSNDLRFSRVGFVDSTSAKVLFREPDTQQLPVFAYYQEEGQSTWKTADRIYSLDEDTDFTYPITFSPLQPSTTYSYSLSNNLRGTFTTPPSARAQNAGKLTFLTSSCIKANFPYSPLSHALAIPGFEHLSNLVRSLPSPAAFMLFLGDFIYVDVPLRLGYSNRHYRSEHRRVYASPSWSLPGLANLPWLHTLDDHEIANDWSSGNDTTPFPAAREPFLNYHVSVNPPLPHGAPPTPNTTYFTFARGPASFFMLDTRAYRTTPEVQTSSPLSTAATESAYAPPDSSALSPFPEDSIDFSNATIIGAAQLSSLLDYLSTPEPANVHWKIIASSVPFTKNWRFGTQDTWGGFLRERKIVLDAMHAAEARLGIRVIILSGDRHEFGAIRFPSDSSVTSAASGPHEFSVGPLSMFYLPFRTFRQIDEEDVAIKYLPDGNSKIGVIDITNLEGVGQQRSLLKYSLWIDGEVAWEYTLTSPGPEFSGYRGGILDSLWG